VALTKTQMAAALQISVRSLNGMMNTDGHGWEPAEPKQGVVWLKGYAPHLGVPLVEGMDGWHMFAGRLRFGGGNGSAGGVCEGDVLARSFFEKKLQLYAAAGVLGAAACSCAPGWREFSEKTGVSFRMRNAGKIFFRKNWQRVAAGGSWWQRVAAALWVTRVFWRMCRLWWERASWASTVTTSG
jgi:hypothetical protein